MTDYISRQAVIDWLTNDWNGMVNTVFFGIEHIPTADVVEVVRCKDCKYATYDKSIDRYDCRNWGLDGDEYTEANDFCSFGERADT